MTEVVKSIFVGVALPEKAGPLAKAYWQSALTVATIALRFSQTNKSIIKQAGKAKLLGIECRGCKKEMVAKSRGQAIQIIEDSQSHKRRRQASVLCEACNAAEREERSRRFLAGKPDKAKAVAKTQPAPTASKKDEFYKSWEWRTLRMRVLKEHGRSCQCCGAAPGMLAASGEPVRICVDHIKPLSKFWHLRLDHRNLQVLCDECNQGKGNWDETDFRPPQAPDEWLVEGDEPSSEIIEQLSDRTSWRLQ